MVRLSLIRKVMLPLVLMAFVVCTCATGLAATIKIGSLNDMTGATSDVGKDYALGIVESIAYINSKGGVNGKKITLIQSDYGYRIPEAITIYKRLRDQDKVVAVLGWGTGDTEALSPTVKRDKMPYVSASYSAHLTNATKTPYNLFFAADYSSSARGSLTAWYYQVWKKDPRYAARVKKGDKPRLMCFYAFPVPYSSAPIKAIKNHAKLLGIVVGPDQNVSLTALDTQSQVLAAKRFKPDVIWHGNTTMSVAAAIRDAKALGLKADHLSNCWGYDENLPRLAGKAALGTIGAAGCAFYGQRVRLMDQVVKFTKKVNPGVAQRKRLIRTVQAWGDALVLWEAMKRADKAGKLTGEGILKKGFETMRNFNIGLGAPPVTYTAKDHRATSIINVYRWDGKKFAKLMTVDLKKMWPKLWPKYYKQGGFFGY